MKLTISLRQNIKTYKKKRNISKVFLKYKQIKSKFRNNLLRNLPFPAIQTEGNHLQNKRETLV
jgi:hypothetical protein